MATLRSLAISLLRLDGRANIAAGNRHHAREPPAHAKTASERMNDFGANEAATALAHIIQKPYRSIREGVRRG
jgi:hypothetical protein